MDSITTITEEQIYIFNNLLGTSALGRLVLRIN
jgi:hypothetical protein